MKVIKIWLKHVDTAARAGKDSVRLVIPELKLKMQPLKRVWLWETTALTSWFEVGT